MTFCSQPQLEREVTESMGSGPGVKGEVKKTYLAESVIIPVCGWRVFSSGWERANYHGGSIREQAFGSRPGVVKDQPFRCVWLLQ